jgi:hypothetical protein
MNPILVEMKIGSNRTPLPSPRGNAWVRARTPLRRPSERKKRAPSLSLQAAPTARVRRWPPALRAGARRPEPQAQVVYSYRAKQIEAGRAAILLRKSLVVEIFRHLLINLA